MDTLAKSIESPIHQRVEKNIRHVVGVMTGTSIDGIDAVLARIEGHGLQMKTQLLKSISKPFGPLKSPLRKIADQIPVTAKELATTAWDFGNFHADALEALIGHKGVDLIAVHGQTVFHEPPISWQLINPWPLVKRFQVPVVFDLRASDLAAGGEGAPITPLADFLFFKASENRAIANLGGFSNITLLPAINEGNPAPFDHSIRQIQGRDVCACNQVLDHLARTLFQTSYDENGKNALKGALQPQPFQSLVELLATQAVGKRSLGTGDELIEWVAQFRNDYAAADLARSACAAIAQTIVGNLSNAKRLILAGGGVLNLALAEEITQRASIPVDMSDRFGVPAEGREAFAIAVLGALCEDREPITLSQVTGVTHPPTSGTWIFP